MIRIVILDNEEAVCVGKNARGSCEECALCVLDEE